MCTAAAELPLLVSAGSNGQNFQVLKPSFYLAVFVLNTEIRISAVLKAGSVFRQVALAPAINSLFLKKS